MTKILTIQDRIIEKLKLVFLKKALAVSSPEVEGSFLAMRHQDIEDFLLESIKEVQEETRKETLIEVKKLFVEYIDGFDMGDEIEDIEKDFDKHILSRLSITNKDKQNV